MPSSSRRWPSSLGHEHELSRVFALFVVGNRAACSFLFGFLADTLRFALLVYAVYRTTNAARHSCPFVGEEARRALVEALYEGARGHGKATVVAD